MEQNEFLKTNQDIAYEKESRINELLELKKKNIEISHFNSHIC